MSIEADDDFLFTLSDVEKEEGHVEAKRNNVKRSRARATKKGGKKAVIKKEKVIEEEKVMEEKEEVEVKEEKVMEEEEVEDRPVAAVKVRGRLQKGW